MKKDVAVVIPYYHDQLTELERLSYKNCLEVLKDHPIILVIPEGMLIKEQPLKNKIIYETVPKQWLESVDSYNRMMLSKEFYGRFEPYRYILIFQLDAFVFSDFLIRFCNYDYDYIGAPWLTGMKYLRTLEKGVWYVGNGGFSLRKVSAFLDVLDRTSTNDVDIHEDIFWASCDSTHFRVAPFDIALKFAFEKDVRQCYSLNGCELPFGCHAWEKYDFPFWRPIFEERGYYIEAQILKGLDKENGDDNRKCCYLEAENSIVQDCLAQFTGKRGAAVYIFGAGKMGSECCWLLRHSEITNVVCVDNNEKVWGSFLWGIQVESPEVLKQKKDNIFIIVAVGDWKNEIVKQLENWGYIYEQDVILYRDLKDRIEMKMA